MVAHMNAQPRPVSHGWQPDAPPPPLRVGAPHRPALCRYGVFTAILAAMCFGAGVLACLAVL